MEARDQLEQPFRKEYDALLEEVLKLQERVKEIKKHNADIKLQNYNAEICERYLNQYDEMKEFDEEPFLAMIDSIKVIGKNRLLYNFKNGYTADVEIIDYYIRNDEIGEVKVYVSIEC